MANKLDSATVEIVSSAWTSLINRAIKHDDDRPWDWTDHEQDVGYLKNVDALLALVEPYLLSPVSFTQPGLPIKDIYAQAKRLFQHIGEPHATPTTKGPKRQSEGEPSWYGFSSSPYPYIELQAVDYVDAAAGVLNLACAISDLAILEGKAPTELQDVLDSTARRCVEFLLSARVDDRQGVRWQGIRKETDPPGKYASLFFTKLAALALHRATENKRIAEVLGEKQVDSIQMLLPDVCKWVMMQYDPNRSTFFMDAGKTSSFPIGVLYALEILYTLKNPIPEVWRPSCASALGEVTKKMSSVKEASALQMDVFHTLPLPGVNGTASYDDRGYIGAFLSLFALAKEADNEVVTDDFVCAGEMLLTGVGDEWIDDPTHLWDDGRPLICYTRDAMLGFVHHALEGFVPKLTLREDEIRLAIREALASSEVVEAVMNTVLLKAQTRVEKSAIQGLAKTIEVATV
jgi:hypothetical protein